eukprot:2629178-Pyramimonas_sp.AAC.1
MQAIAVRILVIISVFISLVPDEARGGSHCTNTMVAFARGQRSFNMMELHTPHDKIIGSLCPVLNRIPSGFTELGFSEKHAPFSPPPVRSRASQTLGRELACELYNGPETRLAHACR